MRMRLLLVLLAVFGIGFALNAIWEFSQMPLYALPPGSPPHVFLCLRASLWDASYLVALYLAIAAVRDDRFWLRRKGPRHELVIVLVSVVVAVLIEVEALRSGRWSYAPRMPLIPGLDVGVTPVLQLAITALATFEIVRRFSSRSAGDSPLSGHPYGSRSDPKGTPISLPLGKGEKEGVA